MGRSTPLETLIKNIYIYPTRRKRFHLSVTYFLTNVVLLTLWVTGIIRKNAIVKFLNYQIPVTQQKGNGDITQQSEISKRHLHAISIYGCVGGS